MNTRREIGLWLAEHIDVVEDASLVDCLDAWAAMRKQRDRAREIAVRLEQQNAHLLALLEAAYRGNVTRDQRRAARAFLRGMDETVSPLVLA